MSRSDVPRERVETSRQELHEIYASAVVEARPFGSNESQWRDLTEIVIARKQGGVVITAWNPGQLRPTFASNVQANSNLLHELEKTSYEIWEADGFSPDRSFREPGFMAWGMNQHVGCALARDFGQFAIFYYNSDGSRHVIDVDSLNVDSLNVDSLNLD